jgi:hypothetical protein
MSYFRMRRNEPWGKDGDLLCDACNKAFYGSGVEWSLWDKNLILHPSCAQHIGMSLIGDARSAGYTSGDDHSKPEDMGHAARWQARVREEAEKMAAEMIEERERSLDPKLVTKRLSHDHQDELID